jgi:hypothetical protein
VVEHGILPFSGERSAVVMFTHEKDLNPSMRTEQYMS